MYWNKANNLKILEKSWFNIPRFIVFSQNNLIDFKKEKKTFNFPLILRSSYSIEDSKKNAFAWIFESHFPIYNENDYNKWLHICMNADRLGKFKSYVLINKINTSKMVKNFIMQEFIIWDFSWICFTKNSKNEVLIEIVPWLNEPLVQWNVKIPFSIKINRNNIKDYYIVNFYMDSSFKTIEKKEIIEKKFDSLQFEENILLNFKDKLLYQFLKIEKILWYPQDIEFSVKWEDIYILQSRHITSIK